MVPCRTALNANKLFFRAEATEGFGEQGVSVEYQPGEGSVQVTAAMSEVFREQPCQVTAEGSSRVVCVFCCFSAEERRTYSPSLERSKSSYLALESTASLESIFSI